MIRSQRRAAASRAADDRFRVKQGRGDVLSVVTRFALSVAAAVCLFLSFEASAQAFPWMIKHDYKVCNVCHADPSGAGLLTQYGRGMEETLVRSYYKKHTGDEDPGKTGNFMFGAFDLPEWLLLQADGRSLMYFDSAAENVPAGGLKPSRNPFETGSNPHFYLMQANAAAQITVSRFRASGDLGLGVPGDSEAASITRGQNNYRLTSRQHWLGLDLGSDNQFLLRAGRMQVPFGLRIIEHTSPVRALTRTNINTDQQYGLALAYTGEKLRGEIMAIAGNFQVRPDDYRERGGAGYAEYAVGETAAVGLSALITHADLDLSLQSALWRHAYGLFGRWSPVKPLVLMAESDLLAFSQPPPGVGQAAINTFGNASMLAVDLEPIQGVHFTPSAHLAYVNTRLSVSDYGSGSTFAPGLTASGWASLTWFFLPHMDFRIDGIFESPAGGKFHTLLLGQLHILL